MAPKPDSKRNKREHVSTSSESDDPDKLAKLLDQKLSQLRKELHEDMIKTIEEKVVPLLSTVNEVVKEVKDLRSEVDVFKKKSEDLEQRVAKLEEEKVQMSNIIQDSLRKANDTEQYSRKYSFRVVGAKREDNESCATTVLKILQHNIGLTSVKLADIAIAHPLPQPRGAPATSAPPIYFRLANPQMRESIMTSRKRLKGSGITIRDDMTRLNALVLNRTCNHDSVESAWFHNGKILFRPKDINKVFHIMPYQDINLVITRATTDPGRNQAPPNVEPPTT